MGEIVLALSFLTRELSVIVISPAGSRAVLDGELIVKLLVLLAIYGSDQAIFGETHGLNILRIDNVGEALHPVGRAMEISGFFVLKDEISHETGCVFCLL